MLYLWTLSKTFWWDNGIVPKVSVTVLSVHSRPNCDLVTVTLRSFEVKWVPAWEWRGKLSHQWPRTQKERVEFPAEREIEKKNLSVSPHCSKNTPGILIDYTELLMDPPSLPWWSLSYLVFAPHFLNDLPLKPCKFGFLSFFYGGHLVTLTISLGSKHFSWMCGNPVCSCILPKIPIEPVSNSPWWKPLFKWFSNSSIAVLI